jgi:hypothetical protein
MKAVKQSNAAAKVKKAAVAKAPAFHGLEELEDRRLMTYWPDFVGMNQVFAQFPWLRGGSNGVAVIDRGIDYMHPMLGANPATNTPSPRIVNVYDWNDNDTNPMPTNPPDGPSPLAAHATGVAGILAMVSHKDSDGKTYQGVLQTSLIYNLRESYTDSQGSITKALQWVLDNHTKYGITAINLTDFVGTSADIPLYNAQVKALWDAGVFIATPVANNWLGDPDTGVPAHTTIGYPGKSPYIFATGGLTEDGLGVRPETQRGVGLDLLTPAINVHIPYYDPSTGQHTYTPYGTGNSWGTPMVVSTAVLLQQIDPTITPAEIMKLIQDSGVYVADTAANASITGINGYKRLDMLSAVKMAYNLRDDAMDQGAGNDTLATASSLSFNAGGSASLTGLKLLAHDHDYFKFTVGADGKFNLSAVAGAQLLDANANVIATLGTGGLANQALAAGTYYIHAYSDTMGLAGAYSVSVQTINQPPPPPPAVVGTSGTFNDVKYDAGGNLHFVWYDASDKTLKYSVRDTAGAWAAVTTIDGAPDVGNFVSLALDSAGKPAVAYYDATNADLKYAKFNGSSWDTQTVESTKKVGYYPSLQFTKSDQPVIAYYYKTGGDLKVATNTGSAWQITTVDSNDDVGRYPSLAINPATGAWAVAYEATGLGAFKYAQKNGPSTWSTTVVDKNGSGGGFVSLAFDPTNLPAFSYYDASNGDLKLARYNGTAWSKTAVASKNNTGMYTNLFFAGATPVIYYYNKTADTLNRVTVSGGAFSAQTLITAGGREDRVARTVDGAETYSYFDSATGDLKVTDLLG